MTDVNRLIAEVAARNGIRIDPDDPAFCLVTLNQLVLEEAGQKLADEIRTATKRFQDAVEKLEGRVGAVLARELKDALTTVRRQAEPEGSSGTGVAKTRARWPADVAGSRMAWLSIGILLGPLIFGCGVLVGIALH